jgi:hypothetical protein
MAITLQDVNKKHRSQHQESLLDKILSYKEKKAKLRARGEQKKFIQRPWESKKQDINTRVKDKTLMKPYIQKQNYTEEELVDSIAQRARRLFAKIDLTGL